jgi:myo-inositol 2-dehydrogenase/D-chiro-inositol 1-dehydrogenase
MPVLNFRFTPNYVKTKELVTEKQLGCPLTFTFREFIPGKELIKQWPLDSWAWDTEKSGGLPNYTLSVWAIDLIQWLFESEIDEIHWDSVYSTIEGQEDTKIYQTIGSAKLRSGIVGTFHFGSSVEEGLGTSQLEIFGCNGKTLKATWNNRVEIFGANNSSDEWTFELKGARVWGHLQNSQYFVECILNNKKPDFGVEDAIKIQRIAKKIVYS